MRIKIALQDHPSRAALEKLLLNYAAWMCAEAELCTVSAEELLLAEQGTFAICFFHSDDHTMALLQNLQRDQHCPLILWAETEEHALEGHNLHPTAYLLMPFSREKFREAMSRCPDVWIPAIRRIRSSPGSNAEYIFGTEIHYIESFRHSCVIHCGQQEEREVPISKSLRALHTKLGGTFLRCHKSYLVNMYYVSDILEDKLVLYDETEIPIALSLYEECMEAWKDYRERMGGFLHGGIRL